MRLRTITRSGLFIVLVGGACLLLQPESWMIVGPVRTVLMRDRLLRKTNFPAVLEAGREMLRQAAQDRREAGGQETRSSQTSRKAAELPKAIRDVGARSVGSGSEGYLRMEMHGGMTHFGLQIYPEDFNEPYFGFKYGDHQILDGLWYYDDEYMWPDYDKGVEAALTRNRRGEGSRVGVLHMPPETLESLSLILQVAGVIATAAITFVWRQRKWAIVIGPALMLVVNVIAQTVLAGEGPGACVGTFALPLYGLLVSWATLRFARGLEKRT